MTDWSEQIQAIRETLELLEAAVTGRFPEPLPWRIRWLESPRGARLDGWSPVRRVLRCAPHYLHFRHHREAARRFAQLAINSALESFTVPALPWIAELDRFELRFVPKNLAGILWLQVAKVAEGHVEHHVCPGCGEWLTLGEGGRRPQTRTHGDACRQRAARLRRAKARKSAVPTPAAVPRL